MRKIFLTMSLVALGACAEKLTGPEAQVAATAHRNEAIASGILFYVNGVEVDTAYVSKLDAALIQSVEVLKGKSARERFGERARYGAVLVSLKPGK